MGHTHLPNSELVKALLQPLLRDFDYWFSQAGTLLNQEDLSFLSDEQLTDLRLRLREAQGEVQAAHALLETTGAGIDTALLMGWHRLVTDCWHLRMRARSNRT
ncbi:MAG: DUF2605 domain-containing protein [Gloeomargaritaceae cyanobacterium C42_A2020_066]|nr:DUF2605 domain-containing protein [Gloeomargaritaceae cyanobacterium C42_A2020_066]